MLGKILAMQAVTKLIEIFAATKGLSHSGALVQRLLSGMAVIVGLSLVTAMLIGMLLIGGIYLIYRLLIVNGLDPEVTLVVVGVLVTALVIGLLVTICSFIRRMRNIPHQLAYTESPITYRVSNLADAFLEGLVGPEKWK